MLSHKQPKTSPGGRAGLFLTGQKFETPGSLPVFVSLVFVSYL
jgi:hypothetical protein